MDKKELLRTKLSEIMLAFRNSIKNICSLHPRAKPVEKADGTPVTALDLALSKLLEDMCLQRYPSVTVYSEENFSDWKFPLMAIDPLDGTKEYIKGRPEWAISVGLLLDQTWRGEGWVYNPITEEIFSDSIPQRCFEKKNVYQGEVSYSEWDRGLFRPFSDSRFSLKPVGSIAYKLGRLAAGKCDFVVSLAPKNIWDIAGGTLLCRQTGIKFYSEGKEVTEVKQFYHPPLIWCFSEMSSELLKVFGPQGKDL